MRRKSKYNVAKFMNKYYPEATLASDNKEFVVRCPWHEGSKRKLYVNAETGIFNCFVCGEKGSFYDLVRRTLAVKKEDVYEIAGAYHDTNEEITLLDEKSVTSPSDIIPYPDDYYSLSEENLGSEARNALKYLYERGINDKQISYYKLGFCLSGRYAGRIITPTFDRNGNLVTYVGRDYTGIQLPKTLNNKALPGTQGAKDWVFNLYNALRTDHLIITEGTFDAIACGVSGVALFGKGITETQMYKIVVEKPKRITVMLDPDAQIEAEKLAHTLRTFIKDVRLSCVPDGYDPGSASPEMIKDALNNYRLPSGGWCF